MNPLTITGLTMPLGITIAPDAEQQKADALALARTITTVSTVAEQHDAIAAASLVKSLVKGMEDSRAQVKRPVLDAGAAIDTAAKRYSKELSAELLRLESLAGDFQRRVLREAEERRREVEQTQRAEREASMRDRESATRYLADKESAHRAQRMEDLKRIAAATTDEARDDAQRLADKHAEANAEEIRNIQQAIRDADEQRLDDERDRSVQIATVSAAPKAMGASVRTGFDFIVEDVRLLLDFRPDLVSIEPKRSLILAAISNGLNIPGIRIFEITKVYSKA